MMKVVLEDTDLVGVDFNGIHMSGQKLTGMDLKRS